MTNIVIFGGTVEGRQIAETFRNTKLQLHISVATEYGVTLLPKAENIQGNCSRMSIEDMVAFLQEISPEYCIDATHPYAVEVTENIVAACKRVCIPYIRVLREEGNSDSALEEKEVHFVDTVEEAAAFLANVEGNIFITTGSKELEKYTVIPNYQERCTARVLPTLEVMEKCSKLGFQGKNVIGMQGPFSQEMNYEIMKGLNATWLVTKNSGKAGGYAQKCEAALRLGAGIVVIGRPKEQNEGSMTLKQCEEFLFEKYFVKEKLTSDKITLVAMGPGNEELLTKEARYILEQADVLIGAKRVLEIYSNYRRKPFFTSYKKAEIIRFLQDNPQYHNIAICYSGDIGFYSGAKEMRELLKTLEMKYDIKVVSGISSVTYFLNKVGVPWSEVVLMSCHGREMDFISPLMENKKVCTLLGNEKSVAFISQRLVEEGLYQVRFTLGERLSYGDERITCGTPQDFLNKEYDGLSVLLMEP